MQNARVLQKFLKKKQGTADQLAFKISRFSDNDRKKYVRQEIKQETRMG